MKISSCVLTMTLAASLFASSAFAVLAQDPTPMLPVKVTPVPVVTEEAAAETTLEVTLEATADAPLDDASQFEQTPIGDLAYNTPVIGRIDNTTPEQLWPLPLTSTDRVRIVVERLAGNLIPDAVLVSAGQQDIGFSYGSEPDGASAVIENITADAAGMLNVRVSRDGGVDGQTEGFYQLTVIPLAVAADAGANAEIVGPILSGEPVTGEISAEHWQQRYTYTAQAADTIRVVGERVSGNLQPQVDVLDANGTVMSTGYVESAGDRAVTNRVSLPAAGDYTIVISRNQGFNGMTTGEYALTVEMIGSGVGSPNLSGVAGTVSYDSEVTGEITPERWYQDWTLTTDAADRLSVTVTSDLNAGNLQPEVVLLGGSGQELTRGYTEYSGDLAYINERTLDAPGTYTLRVSRSQGQTGETAGGYTLLVTLDGAGPTSPALSGATGSIAPGEQVAGEITNQRWADTWTISGTANESIDIVVERTSGTLYPTIEIRDLNGQVLRNSYTEPTRDRTTLQYTFPTTGEYQIVVVREGGQNGATSGSYTLDVTATAQ
jgi:hypothetical protein